VITDPLASMQAACIAISNGEANEIELHWTQPVDSSSEESLTITIRRSVRHIHVGGGTTDEQEPS
jgi:hypothetical protein